MYELPCCHIWQREIQYRILTDEHWEDYALMFEEGGLEVYQSWGLEQVRAGRKLEGEQEEQTIEERQTLRAREQWERLRSRWFSLMEETSDLPVDQRHNARNAWVDGLTKALGPLMRGSAREWLSSVDPFGVLNPDAVFPHGETQEESQEWKAKLNWGNWIGLEDDLNYVRAEDLWSVSEGESSGVEEVLEDLDDFGLWDAEEAEG